MDPTSLHNILNRESSPLRDNEIHLLFSEPRFPCFELKELLEHPTLMNHPRFAFFMKILEKWNKKSSKHQGQGSEIEYRKNEFIFSWLKGLAVQNHGSLDSSLSKLYEWYASNLDQDIVCQVRGQNRYKSRQEDWQIRNSYKSNMPLEINNYRRRVIFGQSDTNLQPITNDPIITPKQEPLFEIVNANAQRAKKENNFIRGVREEREMGDFLTDFRKSKINYFKNTTKNFYRKQFSKDKQNINSLKPQRPKIDSDQHVKSYRIKTGLGLRPFEKSTPNSSFSQTAYSKFFKPEEGKYENQTQQCSQEIDGQFPAPDRSILFATKIDGLGLMANPFEVKPKKKKK